MTIPTDTTILKSDFNAAVSAAIPTVQTPLQATEAALATAQAATDLASVQAALVDVATNLQATHDALSALLVQADEMGDTGGVHADDGGQGDKGKA